jgi:hypothetical protein
VRFMYRQGLFSLIGHFFPNANSVFFFFLMV